MSIPQLARYLCIVVVMTAIVVAAVSFRREYVVPPAGLVDVAVTPHKGFVTVSAGLLSSGARVSRTSVSVRDGSALVRIYMVALTGHDHEPSRIASIDVPLAGLKSIEIGDSPRSITVGHVFCVAVSLPRMRRDPDASRLIWSKR